MREPVLSVPLTLHRQRPKHSGGQKQREATLYCTNLGFSPQRLDYLIEHSSPNISLKELHDGN
jgi:hypothetical protein